MSQDRFFRQVRAKGLLVQGEGLLEGDLLQHGLGQGFLEALDFLLQFLDLVGFFRRLDAHQLMAETVLSVPANPALDGVGAPNAVLAAQRCNARPILVFTDDLTLEGFAVTFERF